MKIVLEKIISLAEETASCMRPESDASNAAGHWLKAFLQQATAALDEMLFLTPWLFDPQFSDLIRKCPNSMTS
jgi:hypothetical protein